MIPGTEFLGLGTSLIMNAAAVLLCYIRDLTALRAHLAVSVTRYNVMVLFILTAVIGFKQLV